MRYKISTLFFLLNLPYPHPHLQTLPYFLSKEKQRTAICTYVCACVRERLRDKERQTDKDRNLSYSVTCFYFKMWDDGISIFSLLKQMLTKLSCFICKRKGISAQPSIQDCQGAVTKIRYETGFSRTKKAYIGGLTRHTYLSGLFNTKI